jgi:hypothetical protein
VLLGSVDVEYSVEVVYFVLEDYGHKTLYTLVAWLEGYGIVVVYFDGHRAWYSASLIGD